MTEDDSVHCFHWYGGDSFHGLYECCVCETDSCLDHYMKGEPCDCI